MKFARTFSLILSAFLAISLIAPPASAQKKKKGSKRVEVSFEDDLVQGDVQKPELFYLLQQKQFNYKRLIRLRKDFLPEMRSTAEEIQRVGGE